MPIELIHNPDQTLYSVVDRLLTDRATTRLRAAVSYVQLSGAALLYQQLLRFTQRGHQASLVCAVDHAITTYEGLVALLQAGVQLYVYRSPSHGFHPKVWLWYVGPTAAASVVGSGNMTRGGLVRNVEVANYLHGADLGMDAYLGSLEVTIGRLEAAARSVSTMGELTQAAADFRIPHERVGRRALEDRAGPRRPATGGVAPAVMPPLSDEAKRLVERLVREVAPATRPAPGQAQLLPAVPAGAETVSPTDIAGVEVDRILVVANLLRQPRTPGELRLSVQSLFLAPLFWDWPDSFVRSTRQGSDYWERHAVCRFRSLGHADSMEESVRIYYYQERDEFRITSSEFRARADAGDIIQIEAGVEPPEEFVFTIVRAGEPEHAPMLALCTEVMPGGRRWGFQ